MAFTEFCCRSGGSNLNAGTLTGNTTVPGTSASFTYAGGTWNGTSVFTVASGNPLNDGVAVGDWASIYTTSGATVATFIARVTARNATTITVHTSAIMGSAAAPSTTSGATTCRIGGAWAGPAGSTGFPFNFVTSVAMNDWDGSTGDDGVRVNIEAGTYSITAGLTHSLDGPTRFQGFTSAYGDGGRAVIDGGTNNIVLLIASGKDTHIVDLEFANNGATTDANDGVRLSGFRGLAIRCVVHDIQADGMEITGTGCSVLDCEAYACGKSTTAAFYAGFHSRASTAANFYIRRSVSHHHTSTAADRTIAGFHLNSPGSTVDRCIAHKITSTGANGRASGFHIGQTDSISASTSNHRFLNCDVYDIAATVDANGICMDGEGSTVTIEVENCNFLKITGSGTGYGVHNASFGTDVEQTARIINCGFGAGTMANSSGNINTASLARMQDISGSVTYPADVTPWVDPDNGDFRILHAYARGTGLGTFTETQSGYGGTVGFPDIGAAQALGVLLLTLGWKAIQDVMEWTPARQIVAWLAEK